ncbi:MAG: hypothetical protein ACI4D3_11635 [Lachnospiraceae bacterium]
MSVEKVNKYKEDKKNRKANLEKERKKKRLIRIGGWAAGAVLVIALVVMLGLTAKNAYSNYQASKPDYSSDSLVISDMTGILDETESDAEEGTEEGTGETAEGEDADASAESDGNTADDESAPGESEAE